jgi:ParB/RepB/Spo0J family partition protein
VIGLEAIPVGAIAPDPGQPRKHFDRAALDELADSIRAVGVLEPIIVRPSESGYTIVAGERRWRSACIAGLDAIPAIVRDDLDAASAFELSMIENVIRADMNPAEEAAGYQQLLDAGMDVATISTRLGKSASVIHARLRLLRLAPAILELVASGRLDLWRAWQMSRVSHEGQFRVVRAMAAGQLPQVNDVDRFVSAIIAEETRVEMFAPDAMPEPISAAARSNGRHLLAEMERALAALRSAAEIGPDASTDGALLVAYADEAKRLAGRIGAAARTDRVRQMAMTA